jgi:hypothetical protein
MPTFGSCQQNTNSRKFVTYLNQLKELNLIKSGIQINDIDPTQEAVLDLIDNKVEINTDSLPESIEGSYKYAFGKLKELYGQIEYSEFDFSIEPREYEDLKYESAVIRFKSKTENYISDNSYSSDYKKSTVYDKLDKQFFRIFNKVLTEQKDSFRIMDIQQTEKNKITLILINNEQRKFLIEKEATNRTSVDKKEYEIEVSKYWNPFELLTKNETQKYFNIYDSIGLFKHLDQAEKQNELLNLKNSFIYSNESIIYRVRDICLGFDWEMFDGNKPYEKAFKEFASITRGEFKPTNIEDNFSFNKKRCEISFDFNGNSYSEIVDVTGDWYSGKFYYLPDGGQASGHIYLTTEQFNYLKSNNLFTFHKDE